MCLHSNPQKDRKVWHIVENQTPYTYQYHTADLFYLVGGGYTHTYIYPNIRAFTVQAEFCIPDLRALHAKPDFFQLAHSASGIILFGLFIPKEFDCDEPFLGHPHTGSQDVASSSHAAKNAPLHLRPSAWQRVRDSGCSDRCFASLTAAPSSLQRHGVKNETLASAEKNIAAFQSTEWHRCKIFHTTL